jgi:hypothetical protein
MPENPGAAIMEKLHIRSSFHHSRWIISLSLLAALFAAGCGSSVPPQAEGRAAAEPFLENLRNDKIDAAWESTSAEFKSDMGRENFRRFVKGHPVLKQPLDFAAYEPNQTNGLPFGACDFRTPQSAPTSAKVRILVAREDDKWKVERVIVE